MCVLKVEYEHVYLVYTFVYLVLMLPSLLDLNPILILVRNLTYFFMGLRILILLPSSPLKAL